MPFLIRNVSPVMSLGQGILLRLKNYCRNGQPSSRGFLPLSRSLPEWATKRTRSSIGTLTRSFNSLVQLAGSTRWFKQSNTRRESMQAVALADRSNLTLGKEAGRRDRPEAFLQALRIVVGCIKEPRSTSIARKH